jgi:hypothetical protein
VLKLKNGEKEIIDFVGVDSFDILMGTLKFWRKDHKQQ